MDRMSVGGEHGTQGLRGYYASRAPEYDAIYAKPERQADLRKLEALLPSLFQGARVLDVACGTGYWMPFIAREAVSVTGVDINLETLERAMERTYPPGGAVDFVVADAWALPDTLGEFDAAFCGFWWSHIPVLDRRRFFAGLKRRLRPGAPVVLLDNRYVPGSSTPIVERDAVGNTWQLRRLQDGSEHRVLKNFPEETSLLADLNAYGVEARYLELEYYWVGMFFRRGAARA